MYRKHICVYANSERDFLRNMISLTHAAFLFIYLNNHLIDLLKKIVHSMIVSFECMPVVA